MKKRWMAILALIFFLAGIALFVLSLVRHTSQFTIYIMLLILPAVLLVVMNRIEEKQAEVLKQAQNNKEEQQK